MCKFTADNIRKVTKSLLDVLPDNGKVNPSLFGFEWLGIEYYKVKTEDCFASTKIAVSSLRYLPIMTREDIKIIYGDWLRILTRGWF